MVHEGSFQFDRLLGHIKLHNSSTCVSIGEGATRIISGVEYDPKTNRCVGFVLPVGIDGLPKVDSFLAVSFTAIENMFNSATVAKYAYVYMAQPLSRNTPPFCLSCMGTDNKFTAEEVLKRWKYIAAECANHHDKMTHIKYHTVRDWIDYLFVKHSYIYVAIGVMKLQPRTMINDNIQG